MEIQLLGQVRVLVGGEVIPMQGTKVPTLLAALALAEGRPERDDRLCAYLWGSRPPATCTAQLYTYVSRLRARLGDDIPIVRHQAGYQLAGPVDVDAQRFQRLCKEGEDLLDHGDHGRAVRVIEEALTLWRGPALMGVTDHLAAVGTALDALRLTAVEARAEAMLMLGQHRRLTFELPALVSENPGRERLRAQLMLALHRSDRQSEALELFHAGRLKLAEELGVAPGSCLTSAYHTILSGGRHQVGPGRERGAGTSEAARV